MADSNNENSNPTNDAFENLRNMIRKLESQINGIKSNIPMDPKNPQNVWADPKNHQFVDNPTNTVWFPPPPQPMPPMIPPGMPHPQQQGRSPMDMWMNQPPSIAQDVAQFINIAETVLFNAMYMPFKSRSGRLSDFFSLVLQARKRMSRKDFTQDDRIAFANWCRQIGNILDISQSKGIWLLDDEQRLVTSMATGKVWEYEGDPEDEDPQWGESEEEGRW